MFKLLSLLFVIQLYPRNDIFKYDIFNPFKTAKGLVDYV